MVKKILLVCFCLSLFLFQTFAEKGEVKYETNGVSERTGNLMLETKDCSLRQARLAFDHRNGISSLYFWFGHNSRLRNQNIDHDFSLTLSFSDGTVETLINEGFSVVPYVHSNSGDLPNDYIYYLYFTLDDDILNKLSTVSLTHIKANDVSVVCPDLDLVNIKTYARKVEDIRNMAADFYSRVNSFEGSKNVKYVQSEIDEFLNKKVLETEMINMSQNQTIGFRAEDTTFYVNTFIHKIGFSSLYGSKIRFVYDDLTYNDVEVSQIKDSRLDVNYIILNSSGYGSQLYDYSCQAVCPRHVLENIVQKKLSYVRFVYDGNTSSSKITNPELIGLYANDILNKIYTNYQYTVPKNTAKVNVKTKFYDFERDENDANNWLVRHAWSEMNESLVMSLDYEIDNAFLKGYNLKFRLVSDDDFSIKSEKDIYLKLENGDVVNIKTSGVKYSTTLHPRRYENVYRYYVNNFANVDFETVKKLAESKISKVRIVITRNSIDENIDLDVYALGAENIQMQAKELVDKVKIK